MAPTTHTETHALVFGQEVSFGSIVGPVDFIDAYADGNAAPNAIVEWRLYATVGTLVSQVAKSLGGGRSASILKWQGPTGTYSPVAADGSTYELRAYWAQQGSPPTMKASIVGYDEFDTAAASGSSSTQTVPAGFGEVSFATASGYSQFADAAVEQNFIGKVLFKLYALAEAGGVEAEIAEQLLSSEDGTNRIFANYKLPGAVSYHLTAEDPTGAGGQAVTASLACYSTTAQIAGIPPGPQITTLRSVIPTAPAMVVWSSTGYIDFVADCGADSTGATDCTGAIDRARAFLMALATNPKLPKTTLRLYIPVGRYLVMGNPLGWDFNGLGTTIEVCGEGDASIFECSNVGDVLHIINADRTYVHDITFVGTQTVGTDTQSALWVSSQIFSIVHRVRFVWLNVTLACLSLQGPCVVDDCDFGDCANTDLTLGVVYSWGCQELWVRNCEWADFAKLNGYVFTTTKNAASNWLFHDSTGTTLAEAVRNIHIEGCLFDEGCNRAIWIRARNTATRIPRVKIEGTLTLPSSHGTLSSVVQLENIDLVEIDGLVNDGFNPVLSEAAIALAGVTDTYFKGLVVSDQAKCNYVTADASCERVFVESSPTVDWSHINHPTTLNIDGVKNTLFDLTPTQIIVVDGKQIVTGTTVDGPSTTVKTYFTPVDGECAALVGVWAVSDDAAQISASGVLYGSCRNFGGLVIAGQGTDDIVGDAVLSPPGPALASFGTDADGITVIFAPPIIGYTGILDWSLSLSILESPAFRFSPRSLSGLEAWYRADLGYLPGRWIDISGRADTGEDLLQNVAAQQPTANASDAAYNNQATLSFDSALSQYLESGIWATAPTALCTIFIVGNNDNGIAQEVFIDGRDDRLLVDNNAAPASLRAYESNPITSAGLALQNPSVIVALMKPGDPTGAIYVSAKTPVNTGNVGGPTVPTGIVVGAATSIAAFLNGKIAEIAMYNRALSQSEIDQLLEYAGRRYGIIIGA